MKDLDDTPGLDGGEEDSPQAYAQISYIRLASGAETPNSAMTVLERMIRGNQTLADAFIKLGNMGIDIDPLISFVNRKKNRELCEIYRIISEYVDTLLHCFDVQNQNCEFLNTHTNESFDVATKNFLNSISEKPGDFNIEKLRNFDEWIKLTWHKAYNNTTTAAEIPEHNLGKSGLYGVSPEAYIELDDILRSYGEKYRKYLKSSKDDCANEDGQTDAFSYLAAGNEDVRQVYSACMKIGINMAPVISKLTEQCWGDDFFEFLDEYLFVIEQTLLGKQFAPGVQVLAKDIQYREAANIMANDNNLNLFEIRKLHTRVKLEFERYDWGD